MRGHSLVVLTTDSHVVNSLIEESEELRICGGSVAQLSQDTHSRPFKPTHIQGLTDVQVQVFLVMHPSVTLNVYVRRSNCIACSRSWQHAWSRSNKNPQNCSEESMRVDYTVTCRRRDVRLSLGSCPTMTSKRCATSDTVRAIGPVVSLLSRAGTTPLLNRVDIQ